MPPVLFSGISIANILSIADDYYEKMRKHPQSLKQYLNIDWAIY